MLTVVLGLSLAATAASEPLALVCSGRAITYTADYSAQLETVEPFDFTLELDVMQGRLLRAPVSGITQFRLEQAPDAVFFFRDARMGERAGREWISINRISGRYANFIAPLDPQFGTLLAPKLLAAADCR